MRVASLLVVVWAAAGVANGELAGSSSTWAEHVVNEFTVLADVVYWTADGEDLLADVYVPEKRAGGVPTVLYFHGGGWVGGGRTPDSLMILPFLQRGWAVVNVGYRLASRSLAPAAVEDARCALRWVYENAEEHGFDTDRIIATGRSAGGHLALMAGLLGEPDGFDHRCPGDARLEVAAVVTWFPLVDLVELILGERRQAFAIAWIGTAPDRSALARRVSPSTYVRDSAPPILTIHGDRDAVSPYPHSIRLHRLLDSAGADHMLHTVRGGGHADFDPDQTAAAYEVLWRFLDLRLSSP